jgi:hypothetical protein
LAIGSQTGWSRIASAQGGAGGGGGAQAGAHDCAQVGAALYQSGRDGGGTHNLATGSHPRPPQSAELTAGVASVTIAIGDSATTVMMAK